MRLSNEDNERLLDLVTAVKEFHRFDSEQLFKLLNDSNDSMLHCVNDKGLDIQIDVERLAGFLPLHLISLIITAKHDESLFKHLLSGMRLFVSLNGLASRNAKLEQILLDDVNVAEEVINLVSYLLVILGSYRQETSDPSPVPLLHSVLVAVGLHLLSGCVSSHLQDLAQILLVHPKVNVFMDVAFGAINVAVHFLQIKLMAKYENFCTIPGLTAEQIVDFLCQQCEASIQFLQLLCQQKIFRERLLKHKELCINGGVLFLIQSILKLKIAPVYFAYPTVVAAVSRMKARILSFLLHLCESDTVSFLDEVAKSPRSLSLAKSVALEVFDLIKTGLCNQPKQSDRIYPMGFLQLNALRVADIFSDDSNFRSFITSNFTGVLSAIFSLPYAHFLPIWCSADYPIREEDSCLEYDSFMAAGWLLDSLDHSKAKTQPVNVVPRNMPQGVYAHQRSSLFVKMIANLHCFIPNICQEQERNLFLHKFVECLQNDPIKSLPGFSFACGAQKTANICRNLRSLLSHAESLIPNFLNEDDVGLLRVFVKEVKSIISLPESEEVRVLESKFEGSMSWDKYQKLDSRSEHHQEGQSTPFARIGGPTHNTNRMKEEMSENSAFQDEGLRRDKCIDVQNAESSGSDTSSTRRKEKSTSEQLIKESENVEAGRGRETEEKLPRKRKRTIMNDKQVSLIEGALVDEPEMQRNTALIKIWADRLTLHGSEVTTSQLRNWINNRKAKLARLSKPDTMKKQVGPAPCSNILEGHNSPSYASSSLKRTPSSVDTEFVQLKVGQTIFLADEQQDEIRKKEQMTI
ncbi:hypothetical protein ACFE04_005943 [Oxalis oulophora]